MDGVRTVIKPPRAVINLPLTVIKPPRTVIKPPRAVIILPLTVIKPLRTVTGVSVDSLADDRFPTGTATRRGCAHMRDSVVFYGNANNSAWRSRIRPRFRDVTQRVQTTRWGCTWRVFERTKSTSQKNHRFNYTCEIPNTQTLPLVSPRVKSRTLL